MKTPLRLDHIALWVADLERMREFYVGVLGGMSGPLYENPRTGFRSYFVTFTESRLELMWEPRRGRNGPEVGGLGYAHVAMSAGGPAGVDERIAELEERGVRVVGAPRVTGDGYYEAVIEDPEGNRIEFVG
jgi:lactoylglutathione lyase